MLDILPMIGNLQVSLPRPAIVQPDARVIDAAVSHVPQRAADAVSDLAVVGTGPTVAAGGPGFVFPVDVAAPAAGARGPAAVVLVGAAFDEGADEVFEAAHALEVVTLSGEVSVLVAAVEENVGRLETGGVVGGVDRLTVRLCLLIVKK